MLVENIMLTLIRSEICDCSVGEQIQNELTKEKYKELYILSKKHDLSHIVASALSRIGFLKDDEISVAFNQQLMMSLYRDTQREYALKLTSDLLEQAHIPHILLKGSVLRLFYPQTWMRTSCDIDVLINKSDADLVEQVLCAAKFVRAKDGSTHDYNYISPNKVHIEIHYTLTQDGRLSLSDRLLESVWNSYSVLDNGCSYRYSMTPELFIVYHLAHLGRHLLHGGCGVRPFLDLWLINKNFKVDAIKRNELLSQCGLLELYNASTELSQVWLERNRHNDATELLEKYILCGGAYGTSDNAAKVQAARGIGKIRSFVNLMFLPRENLKVLYPKLEKYPVLFPFYQVKRWFRIFDKNKQNKIRHLTDVRNTVKEDDVISTTELLKQLGLDEKTENPNKAPCGE